MSKKPNTKLKILHVKDILERKTDWEHGITVKQINELLPYSFKIDRKTIYDDIEQLQKYGMEIEHEEKSIYYKLISRDFELREVKMLIDSVMSSKFLTEDQTFELIAKMERLCSEHEKNQLHRQVVVVGRVKNLNENVDTNLDYINAGIAENKQVSFKYFDYNIRKQRAYRKKGERYMISPFALVYCDENYYMLGYDAEKNEIRPFRVDRMELVRTEEAERAGHEVFAQIKMEDYQKYTFSMYGGDIERVTMRFQNRMMNAVIDRFGSDVFARKVDNTHFEITVPVAVSQQFFGWVFGLGKSVRIVEPEHVKAKMEKMLAEVAERYQ